MTFAASWLRQKKSNKQRDARRRGAMQNKMEDPKIHAPPPQKKPRGKLATLDAENTQFRYSGSMVSWNRFCSLWLLNAASRRGKSAS